MDMSGLRAHSDRGPKKGFFLCPATENTDRRDPNLITRAPGSNLRGGVRTTCRENESVQRCVQVMMLLDRCEPTSNSRCSSEPKEGKQHKLVMSLLLKWPDSWGTLSVFISGPSHIRGQWASALLTLFLPSLSKRKFSSSTVPPERLCRCWGPSDTHNVGDGQGTRLWSAVLSQFSATGVT